MMCDEVVRLRCLWVLLTRRRDEDALRDDVRRVRRARLLRDIA